MVFWIGILFAALFVWLAVRAGFYQTWAMLFNIVIAVYVALFLTPVLVEMIPAAGDTAYGNALTLIVLAVATFLLLHGVSFVFLTGQFKVSLPRLFDIILAGCLGFLMGLLIWSFIALSVSATPIARSSFARTIGFGEKIEQTQGPYICFWCDFVNTFASSSKTRQPAKKKITDLLDQAKDTTRTRTTQ